MRKGVRTHLLSPVYNASIEHDGAKVLVDLSYVSSLSIVHILPVDSSKTSFLDESSSRPYYACSKT